MAKQYWPGENPIGKRLRFDDNPEGPWFTVVGLVGDVRQLGLREQAPALLFLPFQQFALPFTSVAVRSSLPQADVVSLLKSQLAALDPDLPFGDITSLQSEVDGNVDEPRFRAMLIGIFALLALILAAVGVYGLISYTVTQRTREIGIRVALGAAPRQVLGPVVREGLVLALAGIGLGLAGRLRRDARADRVPLRRRPEQSAHLRRRRAPAARRRRRRQLHSVTPRVTGQSDGRAARRVGTFLWQRQTLRSCRRPGVQENSVLTSG